MDTGYAVNLNTARRWAQEERHDDRRYEHQEPQKPLIEGVCLDDDGEDIEAIWEAAFRVQDLAQEKHLRKGQQSIDFSHESKPIAIAFLSDMHFGNAGTDYRQARQDAEIIRDTPGLYAGNHGDGQDNWIVGKLQGLQRGQAVPYDGEVALHRAYLELLRDKWLWLVPGNHDLWTKKIAGLEHIQEALRGTHVLYDPFQVVVDLRLQGATIRHIVRHKYRWGSIFNPTHGQEVSWGRGDIDFDVAIGGHTHTGTVFRPFFAHNKMRVAVQTGTYKKLDSFGDELGFPSPKGSGCGAIIYYPDGRMSPQYDLATAADFLTYLRKNV